MSDPSSVRFAAKLWRRWRCSRSTRKCKRLDLYPLCFKTFDRWILIWNICLWSSEWLHTLFFVLVDINQDEPQSNAIHVAHNIPTGSDIKIVQTRPYNTSVHISLNIAKDCKVGLSWNKNDMNYSGCMFLIPSLRNINDISFW